MIKAQHPDYEIWKTGIHAQRGVSCADCHMPYRTEGGVKYTDHKIQSPLANIANTCQVCHRESEEELRRNVFERQDKARQLRIEAEEALLRAHMEAKTAWDAGAGKPEMEPVLTLIRHAQWRWDSAGSSDGASFHSPLQVARIFGTAIEKAKEPRVLLARLLTKYNISQPIDLPDISTKQEAQAYLGLNMKKLRKQKATFLQTVIPKWEEKAEERESRR